MIKNNPSVIPFNLKNYDWKSREQIGTSPMGAIYKVKTINSKSDQYVAIRQFTLPKSNLIYQLFYKEVEKLKKIKNPYIVEYIDSQIFEEGGYIVMQLCQCNLEAYLCAYEWKMPQKVTQTIINHIMEALDILRKNNYNCLYLNPKNFLVKNRIVKYSPIGAGKYEIDFQQSSISSLPLYLAPEIVFSEDICVQNSSKADVWSIGVIAFELAVGSLPYCYSNWENYRSNIMKQTINFPDPDKIKISQNLKDFILKCLIKQKHQRPNLQQLMHHVIINKSKKPISKKYTPEIANIWKKLKINKQKMQNQVLRQLKSQQQQQTFTLSLQMFDHLCKKQYPNMSSKQITQIFREYDINNNNRLDVNQIIRIFQIFRIHNQNVYVFMRDLAQAIKRKDINVYTISDNFDHNKDKHIDYSQMKTLILNILPESKETIINKVWVHLNQIHGGAITTLNMLQQLLRYLPSQQSQMKSRAHAGLTQLKNSLHDHEIDLINVFEYFDYNKDKKISKKQFSAMFNSIVGFQREQQIEGIFNIIDQDKSGFISADQLKKLWKMSEDD